MDPCTQRCREKRRKSGISQKENPIPDRSQHAILSTRLCICRSSPFTKSEEKCASLHCFPRLDNGSPQQLFFFVFVFFLHSARLQPRFYTWCARAPRVVAHYFAHVTFCTHGKVPGGIMSSCERGRRERERKHGIKESELSHWIFDFWLPHGWYCNNKTLAERWEVELLFYTRRVQYTQRV